MLAFIPSLLQRRPRFLKKRNQKQSKSSERSQNPASNSDNVAPQQERISLHSLPPELLLQIISYLKVGDCWALKVGARNHYIRAVLRDLYPPSFHVYYTQASSQYSSSPTPERVLCRAARRGHDALILAMLRRDELFDDNRNVKKGRHRKLISTTGALEWAIPMGHLSTVKLLLKFGAKPDTYKDKLPHLSLTDPTPLSSAVQYNHEEIVKLLVRECDKRTYRGRRKRNERPIVLYHALYRAIHIHDYEPSAQMAQLLMDLGAGVLPPGNMAVKEGETPFPLLHVAVIRGNVKLARLLIDNGAVDCAHTSDPREKHRGTAFQIAASSGHSAIVKLLLETSQPTTALPAAREDALHLAASEGRFGVVRELLARGINDLHLAGQPVVTSADDRDKFRGQCKTSLTAAACAGHHMTVSLLLESGWNAQNENMTYARAWASKYAIDAGQHKIVAMLLKTLDEWDIAKFTGLTPLHAALTASNVSSVKFLLKEGMSNVHRVITADIVEKIGYQGPFAGLKPLHIAAKASNCAAIIPILIEYGADKDEIVPRHKYVYPDYPGRTALHFAAERGDVSIVNALLDAGCRIDIVDEKARAPKHLAKQYSRQGCRRLLGSS
ncbi:hypothetical protein AJ80_09183 [Polytolypa hystricis UAMH7299]|uniref:Uncharacterized protein n=1 Tax=Polytolypa hystricis (strain UAMH7299) TaxID=1447883 RepID=A0A2B7WV52_POLH7|nr:hypothetical protein AJ80_09183 [Polytolypa hystricis UAMH7299]